MKNCMKSLYQIVIGSFLFLGLLGCNKSIEEIELELAQNKYDSAVTALLPLAEKGDAHALGLLFELLSAPPENNFQVPAAIVNTLAPPPRFSLKDKAQYEKLVSMWQNPALSEPRINFYQAEYAHKALNNPELIAQDFPLTHLMQGFSDALLGRDADSSLDRVIAQLSDKNASPWIKRVVCERLWTFRMQRLAVGVIISASAASRLDTLQTLTQPPPQREIEGRVAALKICQWP